MVWSAIAALMLLPVLGIRVTDEVAWDPGDFMLLGMLPGRVGVVYELAAK